MCGIFAKGCSVVLQFGKVAMPSKRSHVHRSCWKHVGAASEGCKTDEKCGQVEWVRKANETAVNFVFCLRLEW